MRTSPLSLLLATVSASVLGLLFHFRVLPFLKPDMMMKGESQISTAEFASFMSRMFFGFAVLCFLGSVIWFLVRRRAK